ncbi:DHA2 family multidrug resistance protein-like MFS transporter [Allocatelliglobosispora scoriae]|uniref:DHA2 family multidrug resistance protein-like MFS transporter n=1 Tax=Allocatelliglobosispora scoriae TaxID=643052 RepID=A0A841BLS6_9ACTN|nr:MFS transporter [Allocatelliglobosispora scoriae]MBB5870037.1 DHA2 family multidrug resistance protein-like MFS transporter [Allocatelliglobosispora scoriae]
MTMVDAPPKAGRREWIALAILCLPTLLTTVDISILFLALPHISADLGTGPTAQLWVTDIYGFMIAGFLITMGTLGDRIGHRTVLLSGAAGFIVASLLAAYSTSTPMLFVARALLGIAAATVMPSVLALISRMFKDPKQMGAAFGIWGSSIMLGVILGPVFGGLLLNSFWWGSMFLMGIPIMALLLITGPKLLPSSRNPQAAKLDVLSLVLSLTAILPFIYGLKEIARSGWAITPLIGIAVGIASTVLFLSRQRSLANPMLDLKLFGNPAVSAVVIFGLLVGFILGGQGLVIALYLQMVEGLSPLQVGLWLLVPAIGMIVGGNAGPAIARNVRPAYVMAGGVTISAIGCLLLTQVDPASSIALVLIGMGITFLGNTPGGTLGNFLMMSSVPPEKAGTAGSLSSTGGELGIALGVAITGSIATAVYQGAVTVPAGVPAEAGDSIAEATVAASKVDPALAGQLLDSAKDAFTSALHTVGVVNAVLFLALAGLVLAKLRFAPPMGGGAPGMPPAETPMDDAIEPEKVAAS